jgi:hypothetical protein
MFTVLLIIEFFVLFLVVHRTAQNAARAVDTRRLAELPVLNDPREMRGFASRCAAGRFIIFIVIRTSRVKCFLSEAVFFLLQHIMTL